MPTRLVPASTYSFFPAVDLSIHADTTLDVQFATSREALQISTAANGDLQWSQNISYSPVLISTGLFLHHSCEIGGNENWLPWKGQFSENIFDFIRGQSCLGVNTLFAEHCS